MTILKEITNHKVKEVAERQALYPTKLLEQSIYFNRPSVSLKQYLVNPEGSGIIAEFKRYSPSKGDINANVLVEKTTMGYVEAGASALSVLTDEKFFKGHNVDLTEARKFNYCPILRKDFVVDEYQIVEAKSIGADAILLIAEYLDKNQIAQFSKFAKSLDLEVLMEIHSAEQLEKLNPNIDVVGVNNRNLKTFEVNIQNSIELFSAIPDDFVKISESGINSPESIIELKEVGFQGFLIGEYFMKSTDPANACRKFIKEIKTLENSLETVK